MIVGVPTELLTGEKRVALTPDGAAGLTAAGAQVLVQSGAGLGSFFADDDYRAHGATLVDDPAELWARSDLILKVKEPQPSEWGYLRPEQIVFTYLHLASSEAVTRAMLDSGVTGVAYETVQRPDGSLPLLEPMSEVAGRLAVQAGMQQLTSAHGGRGVLLSGVPGVPPADVVVLGAGNVGGNAATVAAWLGARVTVLDIRHHQLRRLDDLLEGRCTTLYSSPTSVAQATAQADLVIGAVLVAGARAPVVMDEAAVRNMRPGAVIVDVAVDQGGCVATTRPTTHDDPSYVQHGVVHYAVTNMPALVPRTSTIALTNVTLPYAISIAKLGLAAAAQRDPALALGVNLHRGRLTCPGVGEAFGLAVEPLAL